MTIKYQAMTTATGASNALANAAYLDALKALILTHANWSLVEDTTGIGTGAWRYCCFKNDHTLSGLPNDFYVLFTYNAAATTLTAYLGEAYNSTTHTLTGVAGQVAASTALDAAGKVPTPASITPTAGTGVPLLAGTNVTGNGQALYAAATTVFWQAMVCDDHMIFSGSGTTQAATTAYYAGGFTSLVPTPATNDPFPFVIGLLSSGASVGILVTTREPLQVASTSKTSVNACYGLGVMTQTAAEYIAASQGIIDNYLGGPPVSRILLIDGCGAGRNLRGVLNNLFYSNAAVASIAMGDTVAYAGTNWAIVSTAQFIYADTGA